MSKLMMVVMMAGILMISVSCAVTESKKVVDLYEAPTTTAVTDSNTVVDLYEAATTTAVAATVNEPTRELTRIDPSTKEIKSSDDDDAAAITLLVKNDRAGAVTLSWIDEYGDRVHYKDVDAGAELEQGSYEGHVWIVADENSKPLGIYVGTDKDATITLTRGMEDQLARVDPSNEKGLKSPEDSTEVTLMITNTRNSAISTYWIDYDGDRMHYNDLEAGEEIEQFTFPGHYWLFVDSNDNVLGVYRTPEKDTTIQVK